MFVFISSPEPKALRWAYSIGRHLSFRPSSIIINIFKRYLLWSHEAGSCQISHIASLGRGNEKLCFLFQSVKNSGCSATYNFLWLIMGKVEIGIYSCLTADILTKVSQTCSLSSPLQNIWILSKPRNLIGCHGNWKAKFAKKIFKNHLLRSHKGDEAETLQKCS